MRATISSCGFAFCGDDTGAPDVRIAGGGGTAGGVPTLDFVKVAQLWAFPAGAFAPWGRWVPPPRYLTLPSAAGHIRQGSVRAIAMSSAERAAIARRRTGRSHAKRHDV